jgi:biotin operon repressor
MDEELETLRARIRDLELALNQNNDELVIAFHLTPQLSNMLGLLLALDYVPSETIRQRLEIATDAKVVIHRLRAHMEPYFEKDGIKIHSRRNLGYWIEAADKPKVKAMVAQAKPAPVTPEVTVAAA